MGEDKFWPLQCEDWIHLCLTRIRSIADRESEIKCGRTIRILAANVTAFELTIARVE